MHGSFISSSFSTFVSLLLFAPPSLSLSSRFLSTRLCTRSLQTARRLLLIHSWWDKAAVGCTFSKVSARLSSSNRILFLRRSTTSFPLFPITLPTINSPILDSCLLETWNSRTSVWKQIGNLLSKRTTSTVIIRIPVRIIRFSKCLPFSRLFYPQNAGERRRGDRRNSSRGGGKLWSKRSFVQRRRVETGPLAVFFVRHRHAAVICAHR